MTAIMTQSNRQFHRLRIVPPRSRVWLAQLGTFFTYQNGKMVSDWNRSQIAIYPPGEFVDWDFTNLVGTSRQLVSPRAQSFFNEEFPGQLQFLPVQYQQADGSGEVTGYAIAHVLHAICCLETSRMRGEWQGDRFLFVGIGEIPLDGARIPQDVDIFCASESPAVIFATERLRQAILKKKLSGCAFTPTINVAEA